MASTIVSWGLTLALLGAITYYYKPDILNSLISQSQIAHIKPVMAETITRPSNKISKSKKSAVSKIVDDDASTNTSANETSNKKRKIVSTPGAQSARPQGADEEDANDKEFAQQLAKAQSGTKLKKPTSEPVKSKTRGAQQPQVKQPQPSEISSEASSRVERDADDELSFANATSATPSDGQAHTARAGDVSDMLEAPGAKPTTLRLTGVSSENKAKRAPAKSFEPVLSKKQRQQQAKKEELRLVREESDRIHEAKKQEQLRRARMADGTSNQTKANNFGSSTSNAWQSKNKDTVKAAPAESTPLLDTFDPSSVSSAKPNGAVHTASLENAPVESAADLKDAVGEKKASTIAASSREGPSLSSSSWSDEMYEEDQMKLLKQQQAEDVWEDVTNKKTKRKTKKESDTASETSSSIHKSVTTLNKAPVNGTKTSGVLQQPDTTNRFDSFQTNEKGSLADADWEA